jgi:response regulator RpfG family c-di-GMP phosphodiesterase
MQMVKAAMDQVKHFSRREKDLTQVAAVLHDIGKTQTLNPSGELTTEGFNVNHEHYTLSVMADELKQLKKTYEQAAIALEYMLTWKMSDGYPKFIGANLIKAADRVSTGLQLREQAFAQLPEYFHFTQISTGARSVSLSRLN